ncbi:MAG TPA: amidohydrolase family protein [Candidatus Eisenbacteria bacterium]|nr:amidohydrolase family protein [Candidatus Eisenbacteria bacterium]
MSLDLSGIPILDQHCHPLLRDGVALAAVDYQRLFSESGEAEMHQSHAPTTIFFRWALKELATFLGCVPTVDAVLAARAAAGGGPLADRMFRSAGLGLLLVDHGYQTGDSLRHAEMTARLPCRLATILRLETLAQDLIVRHNTFDQAVDDFVATVEGARAAGHVGLKSIVAYRTGLAVRDTPRSEAAATFAPLKERAKRAGHVRLADKPLNDYLVHRALEIAAREEMPVQFHTGFGDGDLDLLAANPLHLRPIIERYPRAPVVLLHASYPYVREQGYLAAIYPNVHADLGLAVPYVAANIPALLRDALALAPTSKLLFSTDAYSIPDIFWIAARWGRWGLGRVLGEMIELGALAADEAQDIARHILGGNAARLYGLPWPVAA